MKVQIREMEKNLNTNIIAVGHAMVKVDWGQGSRGEGSTGA